MTTLRKIAEALLDAWPNVQTRCDTDISTTPPTYKLGRVDRQPYGTRFMLGIVSLGDAARYGLRTAALETKKGTLRRADRRLAGAALKLERAEEEATARSSSTRPTSASRATAYPGTMVVYTAARLQNLDQADADKVAQFIRISTTEGQEPGSGNGELPGGFLPIEKTGATAKLYDSAQEVATAVEAQKKPADRSDRRPVRRRRRQQRRRRRRRRRRSPRPACRTTRQPSRQREPVAPTPSAPPAAVAMPATQAGRLRPRRWPAAAADPARCDRLRRHGGAPGRRARRPGTSMTTTMDPTTQPPAAPQSPASSSHAGAAVGRAAEAPKPAKAATQPASATPAPERPPGTAEAASSVLSSAFTMVAIVCLWMAAQMLFLGSISQHRAQDLLYDEFRHVVAGTAGTGAARPDRAGRRPGRAAHASRASVSSRSWSRAPPPATRWPVPATGATPRCPARSAPRSSTAAPRRTAGRSAT